MAVFYEVALTLDEGSTAGDSLVEYMVSKHIPEIMGTGLFINAHFLQLDGRNFKTIYIARDQASLDEYLVKHQAGFKADFVAHFPAGLTPARTVWTERHRW